MLTQKHRFRVKLITGVALCLAAAFLMFFDILLLPVRITMLIVGIALIATSAVPWRAKRS